MAEHPIQGIMNVTMDKIHEMVDANTIIGKPITTEDGTTILPVSRVSFGFASGGTDFDGKNAANKDLFGGGSGAGVNIQPVAFLVIKDGCVRTIQLTDGSMVLTVQPMLRNWWKRCLHWSAKRAKSPQTRHQGKGGLVRPLTGRYASSFLRTRKTGCGTQRLRRLLNEPCTLLATAPTATPCFRRWRRSLPLQAIPSPALLPAAAGSHPSGRSSEKLPAHPPINLSRNRRLPTCGLRYSTLWRAF